MQIPTQAQVVIKEEGTQKLYSILGGMLGAYSIVRIFSYFFPVYRGIDSLFIFYVILVIGVAVVGFRTGAVYTFSRSLHFSAFFLIYYLYTQRNEHDVLQQFYQIRNVALSGFVFLFIFIGLATMITSHNKESQAVVQSVIPSIITTLLLVIFSYSVVLLTRDFFSIFGL